jgi:hypothetical protein
MRRHAFLWQSELNSLTTEVADMTEDIMRLREI